MKGAWDLVAAVRATGTMFVYVGAYYRPTRFDSCLVADARTQPRFGVLTSGTSPKTPEDFFRAYGHVSDSALNVYAEEKLTQANKQLQLMATEAIAFAAASEFREALKR
jgi:hypothetical protein